jgi:hypothetical protein
MILGEAPRGQLGLYDVSHSRPFHFMYNPKKTNPLTIGTGLSWNGYIRFPTNTYIIHLIQIFSK